MLTIVIGRSFCNRGVSLLAVPHKSLSTVTKTPVEFVETSVLAQCLVSITAKNAYSTNVIASYAPLRLLIFIEFSLFFCYQSGSDDTNNVISQNIYNTEQFPGCSQASNRFTSFAFYNLIIEIMHERVEQCFTG